MTCWRSKDSPALEALKWPPVMTPVQPSPVKVGGAARGVAVEDGDGLVVGYVEFAEDVGLVFVGVLLRGELILDGEEAIVGADDLRDVAPSPCQSPRRGSAGAQ